MRKGAAKMATYLYRLGGWSFEHRRKALGLWALVLAAVVVSAAAFKGHTNDKFEVPGTESQQAQELLEKKFPGAGGASARVVFVAPPGETLMDAANRTAVMASVAKQQRAADVSAVVDPYSAGALSKDKRVGYADVVYPVPADEIDETARDQLAATADPAR